MNKRHFKPGVSKCSCGEIAFEWKIGAPACPTCLRRDAVVHRDVSGFDPLRYEARLSVGATSGAPTMRDLTIMEGAQ